MLIIQPIPLLSDNYAWFLRDEATGMTAVLDAAVEGPVAAKVAAEGGRLDWLLITHHHADHIADIGKLAARTGARVAGNAADAAMLPRMDVFLHPGDHFALGESEAVILDAPGHANHHIAWHFPEAKALFSGDTLFAIGCGKLLEGTAAEMWATLQSYLALPDETRVYCGHEYTLSNIRYARHARPDNAALRDYAAHAQAQRDRGEPTVPTTLALEKAANPYLLARDLTEFTALRAGKDQFRG